MKPLSLFPFCLILLLSCMETGSSTSLGNKKETEPSRPPFTNITAAIFSEISYCANPQKQLDKHLPGWKLVWNPEPIGGNYVFAATDGEKYVLAFRGSLLSFTEDAFTNWIYHDLNVAVQDKWPYSSDNKAKISQGTYIAWQNVEKMKDKTSGKNLWSFLSEKVGYDKPLYLTGHSLGGNLAIVYASYLWSKFNTNGRSKKNMEITTFAAPASGNNAFAEDFNKKFPSSVRIENTNDIVAKFPCTDKIGKLGELYTNGPSAAQITIGYKSLATKLNTVFNYISTALELLELTSDLSGYKQTCGDGKQVTVALSGKNKGNTASDWFAEASYQHGIAQYAAAVGAPVIVCE